MTEIPSLPNSGGTSPHQPNFPTSLHERYAPEDLKYARPETIELISRELSILSQRQGKSASVLTGSGQTAEGQQLYIANIEKKKVNEQTLPVSLVGHYSPNAIDEILPEELPHFFVTLKEDIDLSHDAHLPDNPEQIKSLIDNYWVYDRPIGVQEGEQDHIYEPVIYRVSSMADEPNQRIVSNNGVDPEEFKLALKSGNLHRLSETEAKDFLHTIQTVMVPDGGASA